MRRLLPILVTLAVLLGSMGVSASEHCEDTNHPQYDPTGCEAHGAKTPTLSSGDYQKSLRAYRKRDFATALSELKPLAEQGHAGAQYYLGRLYQYGRGVRQDYETALKWYRLSAEQSWGG